MAFEHDDAAVRAASYARRHRALEEALTQADVLIAYGSGMHNFICSNPAWWGSGFKQMGPHTAAVVVPGRDPFLVVTPAWDLARARERSAIADIVACEPETFFATLKDELLKRGLAGKRFAVAGGGQQSVAVAHAWPEVLGAVPLDAEALVSDISKVRDAWSMRCVMRAVAVAEQSYDWLLGVVRPGMWEHQVAAELEIHIRELGAEDNFQLFSASQHNRLVHMPTRRLFEQGDVLLGEITPAVDGEYVQICRTAVLGEPTQLQRDTFALLDEALRAGMKTAVPGTPVDRVVEAINAPIVAAGYERYTKPPFMRTRGHSMAMGSMDPEIAFNTNQIITKGTVFVMHPNQYVPETGYMMCGEPVIITDNGAEPLTTRMGQLGHIAQEAVS